MKVGKLRKRPAAKKVPEEFWIMDRTGKLWRPEKYKYKPGEERFKILVDKEALKKELPGGPEPAFIKYCKRFGLDWESMSDVGHMRWGPVGALLFDLVADYSLQLARGLGIPVYVIHGTGLFSLAEPAIAQHAKLYGERLYEMEIDKRKFTWRYAACFAQFAMMRDWIISYKNLPFGAFELADSYRLEMRGETLLLFRTRKMHMPDLHIVCKSTDNAKSWCLRLHKVILNQFRALGYDMPCLYNLTRSFFERNKGFFKQLLKLEKKPILLRFVPEGLYYWVINVEHHIIDALGRPREIATWQIDLGNPKRFEIKFTDMDNKLKYPAVIHTAMLGTIERYLYAIFDSAIQQEQAGKNPMLPMWLAPVQVRLCPVNDTFTAMCERIVGRLDGIRADIDDRIESVQKKIRDAEHEWVPLIVVIGPRERKTKKLAVRFRESGKIMAMSVTQLAKLVKKQIAGYPFRPLPLPRLLSKRPVFAS